MNLLDIKYWFEDLETQDWWQLAGLIAAALVLLTPWRKDLNLNASVTPKAGELASFPAPGPGSIRTVSAERGKVLAPGDPVFTYLPQGEGPAPATRTIMQGLVRRQVPVLYPSNPTYSPAYQDDENRIRERYKQQVAEAYTYIASYQDQLNRAYREQGSVRGNGNGAYDVQLSMNALARAQQVPGELARKQEQELAAIRAQRDADSRLQQFAQSSQTVASARSYPGAPGAGEVAVTASDAAFVWSAAIRPGLQVIAGQECFSLLPEGAAMEITAAVPVETVKELRPGQAATLEIVRWMHDAEKLELRLDRLANRNLERDEVLALVAQPAADTQYVLATFTPLNPGTQLFPPPSSCRIRCTGARRCLLQRLLF